MSDRIREVLQQRPDEAAFAELMAKVIRDAERARVSRAKLPWSRTRTRSTSGPRRAGGPTGERHRLGRSLRLIVDALIERHRNGGAPLTVAELLAAGWPGERPIAQAGANRVYVEMNRLRKMGLRDLIERPRDGYRLTPETRVVFEKKPGIATRLLDRVRGS